MVDVHMNTLDEPDEERDHLARAPNFGARGSGGAARWAERPVQCHEVVPKNVTSADGREFLLPWSEPCGLSRKKMHGRG